MAFEDVLAKVNEKASGIPGIGKTLRINLGEGIVYIDGTGEKNVVSANDKEADCTVSLSEETLHGLATGAINPMMAVMSGKVKVKGDISVALKLQSLLG
jgi:acyl-CoA dehydrogenase